MCNWIEEGTNPLTFRICPDAAHAVEVALAWADNRGSTPRQERFSLVFRGPLEAFLPQRLYRVGHDVLGEFDLFLVPIAQDAEGFQYEAVFNRLNEKGDQYE